MSSLAREGWSIEAQIIFLTRKRADLQTFHLHGAQLFSTAPHCHPHSVWWAVSALPQVYSGLPDYTTHCALTVHKTLHQVLCVFHPQFLHNFTSSEPFTPSHHRRIQGPELSGAWFLAFCHKCSRAHRVTQYRSESCVFPLSSSLHLRSVQEAWDTFLFL